VRAWAGARLSCEKGFYAFLAAFALGAAFLGAAFLTTPSGFLGSALGDLAGLAGLAALGAAAFLGLFLTALALGAALGFSALFFSADLGVPAFLAATFFSVLVFSLLGVAAFLVFSALFFSLLGVGACARREGGVVHGGSQCGSHGGHKVIVFESRDPQLPHPVRGSLAPATPQPPLPSSRAPS
jgi:hypothetical protein